MSVGQRAFLQVGAVGIGEADQQVVAVGPGQPRLPDGQAVLEVEAVIGAVVGGHGQELGEAFVADGRGEGDSRPWPSVSTVDHQPAVMESQLSARGPGATVRIRRSGTVSLRPVPRS